MKLRLTFAIAASLLLARAFAQAPAQTPKDAANCSPFESFHESYVDRFVSRPGNGIGREVPKIEDFMRADVTIDGKGYNLANVELVSLIKHDPAAVYLSEGQTVGIMVGHKERMPSLLSSKTAQVRDLNDFEKSALARIKQGETLIVQGNEKAVGAIRARASCTACHEVQEGALLGAFSYTFKEASAKK